MTDIKFWKTIDKMNWKSDLDYHRIAEEIKNGEIGNNRLLKDILFTFDEKLSKLEDTVDTKFEDEDESEFLLSHIIGLGKDCFEEVINNPKNIDKYNKTYKESFSYSLYPIYDI